MGFHVRRLRALWQLALLVAGVLAVLFVLSAWAGVIFQSSSDYWIGIGGGALNGGYEASFGVNSNTVKWLVAQTPGIGWWITYDFSQPQFWWTVNVPLWIPIAGCIGAAALARRKESAEFKQTDRCARCGYERTGLSPGAACPECGTPNAG
jgi:4-amino-4-deoxy-L-arabinose transferase-like glycosyltransferase